MKLFACRTTIKRLRTNMRIFTIFNAFKFCKSIGSLGGSIVDEFVITDFSSCSPHAVSVS